MIAKHAKVQFRCTHCGKITIVELKRRVDDTMVISPMPSFARADASTTSLNLPPIDDGLQLPEKETIVLRITAGPESGRVFALSGPRVVIGRKGADLALNDPEISRHHCVVEVRDRFVNLKDLNSTNGTFFEDERVRAAVLLDGAEFRVGTTTIQVSFRRKSEEETPSDV